VGLKDGLAGTIKILFHLRLGTIFLGHIQVLVGFWEHFWEISLHRHVLHDLLLTSGALGHLTALMWNTLIVVNLIYVSSLLVLSVFLIVWAFKYFAVLF